MANRDLFCGSDGSCVTLLSGTLSSGGSGGGGPADSGYNDAYMDINSGAVFRADFTDSAGAADTVTSGEDFWHHRQVKMSWDDDGAYNMIEWRDSSGYPWLAIRHNGSSQGLKLYYNSNTGASPTWTQLSATNFMASGNGTYIFDVRVRIGSPHQVDVYLSYGGASSALSVSTTFTQASFTNIASVTGGCGSVNGRQHASLICNVGKPTIDAHCCISRPSGAGTTNTFSAGTYTAIDDTGVDDSDVVSSGTAGQRITVAYGDLPTFPSGYVIGDTFLWTRARNNGSAPTNLSPTRRDSGGSTTTGSNFSGMGLTYSKFLARYSLTRTEFNASEFGVDSAA